MTDSTEFEVVAKAGDVVNPANFKKPCLIMIKGNFIGQVYELEDEITLIGRSDEVDLVVSDISISRRHAMLINRVDGFQISDLGSTNGTFVNRELIGKHRKLAEGDKIVLGDITFKFSYQDEDDTQYHLVLRNMAVKDGLTHIYNIRYFNDVMAKEFDYNRRTNVGLSLVMFDIDHFKAINDNHGHTAGDYVLRTLAQLVENQARGYDVFARYGGEEFVFLLRGANLDAAIILGERVRSIIESYTFEFEGEELNVTVSLGAGYWDGGKEISSPRQIIEMVDKRLYEAKDSGRNRLCF